MLVIKQRRSGVRGNGSCEVQPWFCELSRTGADSSSSLDMCQDQRGPRPGAGCLWDGTFTPVIWGMARVRGLCLESGVFLEDRDHC